MTDEQIIEWAREAGFEPDCCSKEWHARIAAFAHLAYEQGRKDENEACAKVCLDAAKEAVSVPMWEYRMRDRVATANGCFEAIRARMKGEGS